MTGNTLPALLLVANHLIAEANDAEKRDNRIAPPSRAALLALRLACNETRHHIAKYYRIALYRIRLQGMTFWYKRIAISAICAAKSALRGLPNTNTGIADPYIAILSDAIGNNGTLQLVSTYKQLIDPTLCTGVKYFVAKGAAHTNYTEFPRGVHMLELRDCPNINDYTNAIAAAADYTDLDGLTYTDPDLARPM